MLKNKGPKCGAMLVAAIAITDVLLKSSCTLSSMFVFMFAPLLSLEIYKWIIVFNNEEFKSENLSLLSMLGT